MSAAVAEEENLYALAMCWAVNLSLERGNGDGSCATYVQFGCVVGSYFGDCAQVRISLGVPRLCELGRATSVSNAISGLGPIS